MNGESLVLSKHKPLGRFDPAGPVLASDQQATGHDF